MENVFAILVREGLEFIFSQNASAEGRRSAINLV